MSTYSGFHKFYVGGRLVDFDTRVRYTWTLEGPEIEEVKICIDLDVYTLDDWSEANMSIGDAIRKERARSEA